MFTSILFSLISSSQAANYYLSPVGLRGLSRAGAFVAGADDISAQWYNPAALTRIKGTHFQLYTVGVKQYIDFDRTDYPGEGVDETDLINSPVENESPIFPIPHFGFVTDFGQENLTVLLGFTSPYATGIEYPEGGPQRYAIEDSLVVHTFAGPSIAYKALPWLSIGAGTSWNYLSIAQTKQIALKMSPGVCDGETENPSCDVQFEAKAQDTSTFTWNASVLIEPESQKWAFAFMMQPKIDFSAKGSLNANFVGTFFHDTGLIISDSSNDDDISIDMTLPTIYRAGFLVRPKENLEIELSGVYEGWSILPSLTLSDVNMQIEMNDFLGSTEINDDIIIPTNFSNTYSVRLGWELDISEKWTVRNGYLYEKTGIAEDYLSVGVFDRNKFGYGLGGTWNPTASWSLDAGFYQSFMGEVTLENSATKQTAAEVDISDFENVSTTITDGRTINDGVYSSSALLFGLGMTHHFGQRRL